MSKRCGYVALAGRPNAGKSTFLNHILKEKVSIVSDKPQTTRNRILGVYHAEDLQIGFLDLPGIHKPHHAMNVLMMKTVKRGLNDVDLILHFIDVSQPLGSGDRFVHQFVNEREVPVIVVANKMDLVNKSKVIPILEQINEMFNPTELVPISSETGDNIPRLLELMRGYMPEGDFLFSEDTLTDQPVRQMAQEFIREKILHHTHDELPHAVAVTVEKFEFSEEEDRYYIDAVIWVERKTQRKIMLGKEGSMIAKIRRAAQRSLKGLLDDKPSTLDLYVKVRENWRDHVELLNRLNLEG